MGRFIRYHGFIFHHFGSSFVGLCKAIKALCWKLYILLLTIYANIAGKVFQSVNFIQHVQFTVYLATVFLQEGGSLLNPGPALAYLTPNSWQTWTKVFPCSIARTHHTLCCSWNSRAAAIVLIWNLKTNWRYTQFFLLSTLIYMYFVYFVGFLQPNFVA